MLSKPQMIEFYRLALLRLVAGLFARAGIEPGTDSVETLPRFVRSVEGFRMRAAGAVIAAGGVSGRVRKPPK